MGNIRVYVFFFVCSFLYDLITTWKREFVGVLTC
jgi:hypothetical protein